MKKSGVIISICTILIAAFIAYLPSLESGFTNWDDESNIIENVSIRELSWKNIRKIFTSRRPSDYYKPLTVLSYALEYHFFRLNPFAYHATNLLLHLLNTLLVFWLILLLSRRVEVSLITALLFAVHPLQVESVAWINQRKNLLYAVFFLGSLIAYLRYRKDKIGGYLYLSLFLFLLSLLAKPQGVFLPLVLLLFDYLLGRRFNRKVVKEKLPFVLLALAVVSIGFIVGGQASWGELGGGRLTAPRPVLLSVLYGSVFYLFKLTVPVELSCLYPYPRQWPLLVLYSPFILATLIVGAVYSVRYTKKIIFAGIFFLINIVLVLQIVSTRPSITADHYAYVPSIGLFYLGGEFFSWLYRRKDRSAKAVLTVGLVLIVVLFSCLTWLRCEVWRDSETLWRNLLNKYPDVPIGHINLGTALLRQEKFGEAIAHFNQALEIWPDSAEAHFNLGCAREGQGSLEGAVRHYREALKTDPAYSEAHNNLGTLLNERGEIGEAVAHYRQALRFDPDHEKAHYNLGIALEDLGRLDEAVFHYRQTLRINPANLLAHNNLGIILNKLGRNEEAVLHFNEALKLDPDFDKAHKNLGFAYFRRGKLWKALYHYTRALTPRERPGPGLDR